MMDLLKRVFGQEADAMESSGEDIRPHDERIAACALLLEMAKIDDVFSPEEQELILQVMKEEFGLSEAHAIELTEAAEQERQKSHDLWHFTELVNDNFSKDEKIRLVEMIWKIVFADGKLDGHEDELVHRMAKMLNLAHKELIDAKLNVLYEDEE